MQHADLNKQHLPTRKKLLVETLEKRILYSADAGAVLADIQDDAIEAEVRVIEPIQTQQTNTENQTQSIQQRHEIVFIDESVDGYEVLINDLLSNGDDRTFEIYTIHGDNGIDQITSTLAGIDDVNAIHIITHGDAGQIQIGDATINNETFQQFSQSVSNWSDALNNEADILFYGCNVAATADGQQLLAKIAEATGADIAASTDLTGNVDAGGDWVLESNIGHLETASITNVNWQGTLALTAEGGETLVNQTTVGFQEITEFAGGKQVATDANGNYVIVWESADGTGDGIYAQRFNAAGVAQGSEFLVNSYGSGSQERPAVAMDDNGNFVITWQSQFQDGSGLGIYAQRYDAAGVAQGAEFQVNTYTTNDQNTPAIAMDANGNFVITWVSQNQDGSGEGVYAQRYNAAGVAQGAEIQVNTYTTSNQNNPDIAMDDSGNFVITWSSDFQDTSSSGIFAQRFDAAGVKQGAEFQVNTYETNTQGFPSIAMNSSGDFIIAWESYNQDSSLFGVFAQRYNAAGIVQGSEFQVNTYSNDDQYAASVAMDDAGRFIVTWTSYTQDGSFGGIYAQLYHADGTANGTEFQISTSTTNEQLSPSVAWSASGNIIVNWSGNGTQTGNVDSQGVFFQRYRIETIVQAVGDSVTTNEDTPVVIDPTANDTDMENDTINIVEFTQASNGTVVDNGDGTLTYTPNANYSGSDAFEYVAIDSGSGLQHYWGLDGNATDSVGGADGTLTGTTTVAGDFGNGLNFNETSNFVTLPDITYNSEFTISLEFKLTENNGSLFQRLYSHGDIQTTNSIGIFLTENAHPTNPSMIGTVVRDGNDTLDNYALQVDISPSGLNLIDGQFHTYTLTVSSEGLNVYIDGVLAATDATRGTEGVNPTGNVYLGARQDFAFDRYFGGDLDTVQIYDNALSSDQIADLDSGANRATVNLTVTPVNDAGTFGGNLSATTNEDTATAGTVTFSDAADGYSVNNFAINTAATNGTATIDAAGNWTYTPNANFNGSDSFIVQVTDDDGNVETETVTITVTQVNDAGTFGGDVSATTNEDTGTSGTVTFSDAADGFTTPNFSINTAASNGTASIDAAGNWTYTPSANFNGSDSFTVQVTDDDGNVETETVTITVTQVNDAGTFGGTLSATTNEDTGTSGTVTFSDAADGYSVNNFAINTAATNGTAAIDAAGNWTYTPNANFNGADSFTVQVTDDDGNVETKVISITVNQVNDAGTFGGTFTATTNEDTGTSGTVTFSDAADGYSVNNFAINTAASNGTASIDAAGNWTYTPNANFNGSDSFIVQVTDDDGNVETKVISITVNQVNDAGTFGGNLSATTNEDTATSGTVTFSDAADGYSVNNFAINTAATNGTATIDAAGNWTYTPSANFNGSDAFTVQVTDDDGNVETQVISITVTQVNDAGTFGGNLSATTNEDTATSGTVTFADAADGYSVNNFAINTAATNGTAAIDAAGNWTYTPSANFNGSDSFTVQVTDDDGNVETKVISITVNQVNDAGTFGGTFTATTNEDTGTSGTVTFSDAADGYSVNNFAINTAATNGTAAIDAAGNWTYTPNANFNGSDSFIVQVTDDDGNVETETVSITVTQVNDAGTFGGTLSAITNEDTATAGTVTFSDAADGYSVNNFAINTAATNGTAAIDAAGNWTYTPSANFNGSDSFTVQVTDDDGNVETKVISITVTQVNDTGTFGGNTSATTNEDTATAGTVTFTDTADGFTTPNFSLNTAASNGTASIDAAGNWTYTPSANFNGSDSFIVQVTDDDGNVETETVSITVTQVNDAGTFGGNLSATTNEDTATSGTVTFTDAADGYSVNNFAINTAATNGTASIDAAGNWTYTPNANFNGSDSFIVQVTDDDGNVETQVISITVNQVNNPGTFGGNTSATTNEDTATSGTVTFSDAADGFTTPNFSINTAASNGTATIDAAGNWTYTPSANFNGSDSFTVQVTDDDGNVETKVISITVNQVNDAGTFGGTLSATTNEDTATAGTVTFSDAADGYSVNNFAINTAATNGTASIDAAGNWTYTPNANFNGSDSFIVQVTDDDGNVETKVISITVTQVNDAGTFGGNLSATTNEDTATSGTVTFTDAADGFTTPNFSINTAASNGTASIDAAGNWTYTPNANFNGSDSFIVQVTDDDGNVETETVSITVTQVNDAGTFGGDVSATTNEDTGTSGTVTFSDAADGYSVNNFAINTAATNGTASIDAAGNWTYTPNANFNGSDSFIVQVTDDDGNVETKVISITVNQVNDAGTFGGTFTATTNEDTGTSGTVTFSDAADGFTTPNFSINTAASNGTAAIDAAGNWTYTPNANFNGADSFTVQVTDDDGNVETQVISITVNQVNNPGTFGGNTSATTNEDTATSGTVTFTDAADGYSVNNFAINTAATNGTASIDAAGNWTYTPSANFNGSDSFIVQVTDDDGNVETETVSITVTQVNDAGTFGGDVSATTNEDTGTSGTVTFSDAADGYSVNNFAINTAATNGTATIDAAGNWTYTPSANFNGSDSFIVQVTDDDGNVETKVISITVNQVNDAGTFGGNTSATTNEDTGTSGTVTFTDAADGFTTPNFSINTAATNGTASIDAAGNWTYTPSANFNGSDSFTVQVTDDDGNVETKVISITVNQVNDAGTFGGTFTATTNEDTGTSGTVTFADAIDGYSVNNFAINTAATNGTAAIDAAGNWTYTPSANFNGSDSFTVQVTDDDGNVETETVSITVNQVNDAGTFGGNISATTNQNMATSGTVTFSDAADGYTTPNFTISTAASNGVATISSFGNWSYKPTTAFSGSDSFTIKVSDDNGNVQTQTINITINPVDDVFIDPTMPNSGNDEPVDLHDDKTPVDNFLALYFDTTNLNNLDVITYEDIPNTIKVELDRVINNFIGSTDIQTGHSFLISPSTIAKALRHEISNVIYENIAYYFTNINDSHIQSRNTDNFEINQVDLINEEKESQIVNDKVTYKITGTVMSASAIWWALRATGLLGSLLTSIPAWRQVDLLAVLPGEGSISNNNSG